MNRVTRTGMISLALVASLAAAGAGPQRAAAQGEPRLVADLNQEPAEGAGPGDIVAVGDLIYFAHDDGEHGVELWRSDGTEEGTWLVADVRPGRFASSPAGLTQLGDRVLFSADDGVHGRELWASDGTPEGTRLLADVQAGDEGSYPTSLTAAGGRLFFVADDVRGNLLWVSDGTPEGTHRVASAGPAADLRGPSRLTAWNDRLYFVADDEAHGRELWRSDGSEDGTVLVHDLELGPNDSDPRDLVVQPTLGLLFFTATTSEGGVELWRTDGDEALPVAAPEAGDGGVVEAAVALGDTLLFRDRTIQGTSRLLRTRGAPGDAEPVADFANSVGPQAGAVLGAYAYFHSFDPVGGAVILRSDGTPEGTGVFLDLNSFPCSAEFSLPFVVAGGNLFFAARQGRDQAELWATDGTADGTRRVKDIFPGRPGGRPAGLVALGDAIYFRATDGLHGRELWRSDGTADGTTLVADVFPGNVGTFAGFYTGLVPLGGSVLFASGLASRPAPLGDGLWRSDGSAAGTAVIAGTEGLIVNAYTIFPAATRTYFWGADATHGNELWRTDGTPGATALAVDVVPGPESSTPSAAAMVRGDTIFFPTWTEQVGDELWSSDGTATGTSLLADAYPGPGDSAPRDLVRVGDRVFFSARPDWLTGRELWVTDGTRDGTHQVANINPQPFGWGLTEGSAAPIALGDVLYFAADDGTHGRELWRSDGSAAGTVMVRDVWPGPGDGLPYNYVPITLGDLLLFTADDGTGNELWRSDGTATGTFLVEDLSTSPLGSRPILFPATGRRAFFSAEDDLHGRQPWVTDGTAEGTHIIADPSAGSSNPALFQAIGDYAYFSAEGDGTGVELWVTDGSAAGTREVADIAPGIASSYAYIKQVAGGRLYFIADDGVTGAELWALSCGDGAVDTAAGEQCDDGAANGAAGSCCTAICTLYPGDLDGDGTGDRCDPADATLELRRARVRADAPSPKPDGVVTADGYLTLAPGTTLDASRGFAVSVRDGGGLSASASWTADGCRTTRRGVVRCPDRASGATLRLTPVGADASGARRFFFRLRLDGRALAGPFAAPVEVTITHGEAIDRRGTLGTCASSPSALSCKG